jgi:hypothetical protein
MLSQSFKSIAWAAALAALPGLTLSGPPTIGERALLGWTPPLQAGTSNLRLAHVHGPVTVERALLGKRSADEGSGSAEEAIQIRPHPISGSSSLLGR